MIIVFFQGTFDILNAGHVRAMREAKSYGDYLVLGLNTDELVLRDKGRLIIPYVQRHEIISGIKYVDRIVPCDTELAITYLKENNAKVFVLTEEWKERHLSTGIKYIEEIGGKVVYSPRYPDVMCSTDIRNRVIAAAKGEL